MNIDRKKQIINTLLENKFNLDNFKDFVANILNVKLANRKISEAVFKVFKDYIENYQTITEYKDTEDNKIYIMVVKIKDEKDPIRARVKQREFVAKLLRDWGGSGALVVFYNENNNYWRMSFVRLNYEFTVKGIKENLTPAKRLSYVIGEGEACKTAKDQFHTLGNIEESVSLDQLEEVFALEKVTNEFFKEYKNKYLDIKEILLKDKNFMEEARKHDIENPESFTEGFAKKLMGQLSFIYFLQKKGWLGIKIVADELSYNEFDRLYNRALDKEKEVLVKVYDRVEQNLYILNYESLVKLDNKTESELLVRPFHNTKYFKDWGSGDKKFIRTLFEEHKKKDISNKKTFFEDYLEPLFYNNFAQERGDLQYSSEFNSRIPFLNGGLFDPYGDYKWRETKFNLADELFSNAKKDGILDIFDTYNFTINENDSYETEVAVDPEMLGKVFENLLDVSDRKSKGAFYTPREIVRYMTNESIMNYLLTNLENLEISKEDLEYLFDLGEFTKEYDQQIFEKDYLKDNKPLGKDIFGMPRNIIAHSKEIDELLRKVRIADPACGSGAFPLGILNEIVRARNVLTFYINMVEVLKEKDEKNYWDRVHKRQSERKLYNLKLYTIQNCLYGVDIEPSAIDIAKLRLWLSIIVDSANDNVRPLPNLDFNFMIGNSLVDEFEGMKLFDESLLDDKKLEKKLKTARKATQGKLFQGLEEKQQDILKEIFANQALFFNEKNSNKKKELKEKIENFENDLIELTMRENGDIEKLEEIKKKRKERRKPYFLWKLEFAKIFKKNGGFDIVIGNPPYIGEDGNKNIFREVAKTQLGKDYYIGKMDYFYFFFHLGLNILTNKGILGFITTNYFLTADGAKKLRQDLKKRATILNLLNFNEVKVFENAKGQHNIITILKKGNFDNISQNFISRKILLEEKDAISKILLKQDKETDYYSISQNNLYETENFFIRLNGVNLKTGTKIDNVIKKMMETKQKLKNIAIINQGLISGCDTLKKGNLKKIKNNQGIELNDGIFVLDLKNERDLKLYSKLKKECPDLLKPFFKNSEIKKFLSNLIPKKYVIYIKKLDEKEMPILYNHLLKFKDF